VPVASATKLATVRGARASKSPSVSRPTVALSCATSRKTRVDGAAAAAPRTVVVGGNASAATSKTGSASRSASTAAASPPLRPPPRKKMTPTVREMAAAVRTASSTP